MKALARLFSALALLALLAMVGALIHLRPAPPPLPPLLGQIDLITVSKSARSLTLFQNGRMLRQYHIALGFAPKGDKSRQGDGRTPEGRFHINRRNEASAYHLSLGLDYPQPDDITRARAGGFDPGGDIMIHGQPNALPDAAPLKGDWTAGCIALSNAEMREIWAATGLGTLVEIRP